MSSNNYNISADPSEGSAGLAKANEKGGFQQYHLENMYNTEGFVNPHDIAGVKGIVKTQMDEIENKKVQFRMANEFYLRKHPEINKILSVFMFKLLDDKPDNILSYAGKFFDNPKLKEIVELEMKHYLMNS